MPGGTFFPCSFSETASVKTFSFRDVCFAGKRFEHCTGGAVRRCQRLGERIATIHRVDAARRLQNIDKRLAELGDKGGKESEALRALRSVLSDSDSARFVLDVGLTGGGRPVGLNDMIAGLLAPLDEKRYATISPPSHQMIGFAAKRHGVKIPHLFTTEQARSIAGEWGDFG